jgi:hypothetical protein
MRRKAPGSQYIWRTPYLSASNNSIYPLYISVSPPARASLDPMAYRETFKFIRRYGCMDRRLCSNKIVRTTLGSNAEGFNEQQQKHQRPFLHPLDINELASRDMEQSNSEEGKNNEVSGAIVITAVPQLRRVISQPPQKLHSSRLQVKSIVWKPRRRPKIER